MGGNLTSQHCVETTQPSCRYNTRDDDDEHMDLSVVPKRMNAIVTDKRRASPKAEGSRKGVGAGVAVDG